jgi:hypothetical protein
MKILKVWAGVALCSGMLSTAAAQDAALSENHPTTVSVTATKSSQLKPGEDFTFVLEFNKALNKHKGQLMARFQRVSGPPPRLAGKYGEDKSPFASADIQDGQQVYTMSLHIGSFLAPGRWKLVDVSIGGLSPETFTVSQDITFDIPELPPLIVHVAVPKTMQAEHSYTLTVALDEYPTDIEKGCVLFLQPSLSATSARGGPMNWPTIELKPGQLVYQISHTLEPDFPSSSWDGKLVISGYFKNEQACRYPELKGDHFSFNVEANPEMQTPSSVRVTVNPSQIELLKIEAGHLRAKAAEIKKTLSPTDTAANKAILQNALQQAVKDLAATESEYKKKETEPPSPPAVDVFFHDIKVSYDEARAILDGKLTGLPRSIPQLVEVKTEVGAPEDSIRDAVLDSIDHNVAAYETVAQSGAYVFSLEVLSQPQDAEISFRRRGEQFRSQGNRTNSSIVNLPRAVYVIRLQKPGCDDDTFPFDATDSNRTTVPTRQLTCATGPK